MTPREFLRELLASFLSDKVGVQSFCEQFERVYNLELDKATLQGAESVAFGELFERVVWYSPFPNERENISNYLGDAEIKAAAQEAAALIFGDA